MIHTGLNSVKVNGLKTLDLKNISSLSVSNYSTIDIYVMISNVKRPIPAFNPAINIPYVFTIDGDGTLSDMEITIGSDAVGTINAIVDYRKQKC